MLGALRTGLIAIVISAGASAASIASITSTASTAGAAPPCVPAPNLVLVQIAQVGGSNPALLADVQAVEQADATQGAKSAGEVVQDLLVAATRNGYQWDCAGSRLVSPNLAGQSLTGHSNAAAPAAAAAKSGAAAAAVGAGDGGSGGSGDTSGASASPTSVRAQAAPASGTSSGGTSRIPIPVIVVGLILCSAALFAAVRLVSRQ